MGKARADTLFMARLRREDRARARARIRACGASPRGAGRGSPGVHPTSPFPGRRSRAEAPLARSRGGAGGAAVASGRRMLDRGDAGSRFADGPLSSEAGEPAPRVRRFLILRPQLSGWPGVPAPPVAFRSMGRGAFARPPGAPKAQPRHSAGRAGVRPSLRDARTGLLRPSTPQRRPLSREPPGRASG